MKLTAERLRELLFYDPTTGVFTRRVDRGRWKKGHLKAGTISGTPSQGYWNVQVDGILYRAHRLAWLYMTNTWPQGQIDHIDCNRSNNRFANLRDASAKINRQNRKTAQRNSKTGVLGVSPHQGKYVATINNKQHIYLGIFDTLEEAQAVYLEAKRKLHEGCTI